MDEQRLPVRDVVSGCVLLALLVAAVLASGGRAGPGPLALCAGLAAGHAALLAPSLKARWALLPPLLALPALAATAYGHPGAWPLVGSALLVGAAALAGAAACWRPSPLYIPGMLLAFAAPCALGYLVQEFGDPGQADAWRGASPWMAAESIAAGRAPSAVACLLLFAWPVWALARRPR